MEANGAEVKRPRVDVVNGLPVPQFGLPEIVNYPEQWRDGLLFVMRVDGRSAWLEPHGEWAREPLKGLGERRGGIPGVSARNRTSTADYQEPHGNS